MTTKTADKSSLAKHDGFTIERDFKSAPSKVFAAFANSEAKQKWFGAGEDRYVVETRKFDFREGGSERLVGKWHNGMVSDFEANYWEIIENKRIVYAYAMRLNGVRISVNLATMEFEPKGSGCHFKMTEQGAYLVSFDPNGDDNGSRRHGTEELIGKLAASLGEG